MTFKKRVKIGAHWYKIEMIEETPMLDDDGGMSRSKGTIYINKSLPQTEQFATLIHEFLHVANNELEHSQIEFLAQAFAQFLLDNDMIKR